MSASLDRATAALLGVALGDALGMPTEGLTRAEIRARHGVVTTLLSAPERDMPAGHVTDDTEQTLMLAEAILDGGGQVRAEVVTRHLLAWVDAAGEHAAAVIGPSTARALELLRGGADPRTTAATGTTNGAAMRIVPVGLRHPPGPALVDAVVESCAMSHHTSVAIAAAALVAGVVSAALDGADLDAALEVGLAMATDGTTRGHPVDQPSVVDRAHEARRIALEAADDDAFLACLEAAVGTSVAAAESVPAAVGCLVRGGADPWRVAMLGANAGGDTDTIAAMAAAMAAALAGTDTLPADLVREVLAVNGLSAASVTTVAERLLALRSA